MFVSKSLHPGVLVLAGAAMLIASLAGTRIALAQAVDAAADRPRIGLALSGGGARGGAQIGILRALEELRIPVDYIAGTSIGAVVGGLYACGLTTEELQAFAEDLDLDEILAGGAQRRYESFRSKLVDQLYLAEPRLGLDGALPRGAIHGQAITETLLKAALPCAGVDDFDRLRVPFRAIAGDLETREEVLLASGNLSQAMRASVTVPVLMAPYEYGDRWLVDGGFANNLPIDVVKAMGADRVIAIDASDRLLTRDDMDSVDSVLWQMTTILTMNSTDARKDLLTDDDLLLVPELPFANDSAAFEHLSDNIRLGYEFALAHREQLEQFALDGEAWNRYRQSRASPRQPEQPAVDFVRIVNHSIIADSILNDRASGIAVGEPLDIEAVEGAVDRLAGLGHFQHVDVRLVAERDQRGLELEPDARSWGPDYLQPGLSLNLSSNDDDLFTVAASVQKTAINAHGADWRATVFLGDEPGLLTRLHQPWGDKGRFFTAPVLNYESRLLNDYRDGQIDTQLRLQQLSFEFGGGRELAYFGEIRGGLRTAEGDSDLRIGSVNPLGETRFRRGEIFVRLAVDTFDDIDFPTSGTLAGVELRRSRAGRLAAEHDFDQLLISMEHAGSWGAYTLLTSFRYDSTVSGFAPFDALPRLGGFLELSGLNREQLSGQHVARIGTRFYRRIDAFALAPIFVGLSLELGNAWETRSVISARSAVLGRSVFAGADTPIGPLRIGYGKADGGSDAWYVSVGRVR